MMVEKMRMHNPKIQHGMYFNNLSTCFIDIL